MNLIKFIIVITLVSILLGCCFLANSTMIDNYFSKTTLSAYDRYDIRTIDENDVNYIKWLAPGILPDANKLIPSINNQGTKVNPIGIAIGNGNGNSGNISFDPHHTIDPNVSISDEDIISKESRDRNFGNELPWDREVGFCEVLKNTDRDLYQNVQDSTTIVFY